MAATIGKQDEARPRRVYDILTLIRLSQSSSCLGLQSLRLSPDIPWTHVLKFATERRARAGSSNSLDPSDEEDRMQALGKGVILNNRARIPVDARKHSRIPQSALEHFIRDPRPPPPPDYQSVLGFAKFLKDHTSPPNKRVTAGGRIVPAGPKSPPPTFQVEYIDSVLRTAQENVSLLEEATRSVEAVSNETALAESASMKSSTENSSEHNIKSDGEDSDYQYVGTLKIPKIYDVIKMVNPKHAIVLIGNIPYEVYKKDGSDLLHYRTLQNYGSTKLRKAQQSAQPASAKTVAPQGAMNSGPHHDAAFHLGKNATAYSVGQQSAPSMQHAAFHLNVPSHTPALLQSPQPHRPYLIGGSTSIAPTYFQEPALPSPMEPAAKNPASFLEGGFSSVPEEAWSVDLMTSLRAATEEYEHAASSLKEHEKYTALNDMHMSVTEQRFANDKKKYLILARDQSRKKKEHFEELQAVQLQQMHELEAHLVSNWHPQVLAREEAQQMNEYSAAPFKHFPLEKKHMGSHTQSSGLAAHRSKKALSPKAAEFVPAAKTLPPQDARYSEVRDMFSGSPFIVKSEVSKKKGSSEDPSTPLTAESQEIELPSGGFTAEWIRKELKNSGKGKMQREAEARESKETQKSDSQHSEDRGGATVLTIAQQASLNERSKRRSRMSIRHQSQEASSEGQENYLRHEGSTFSTSTEENARLGWSSRASGDLSEVPQKEIRLATNSGRRYGVPQGEASKSPVKAEKIARFGVADALAAFKIPFGKDETMKSLHGHVGSLSESALACARRDARKGADANKRGSTIRNSSREAASKIEERILKGKQKAGAESMVASPYALASKSIALSQGSTGNRKSPPATKSPSTVSLSAYPTATTPNFRGTRIFPGSGAKVGATHHVDNGNDAQQFSVPATAGAAITSLRSTLTPTDTSMRGGYQAATPGRGRGVGSKALTEQGAHVHLGVGHHQGIGRGRGWGRGYQGMGHPQFNGHQELGHPQFNGPQQIVPPHFGGHQAVFSPQFHAHHGMSLPQFNGHLPGNGYFQTFPQPGPAVMAPFGNPQQPGHHPNANNETSQFPGPQNFGNGPPPFGGPPMVHANFYNPNARFPVVDPNRLPLSVYADPYRPYTPRTNTPGSQHGPYDRRPFR